MSIINSITNLVDLNTTRYNRKLRTMRSDTKRATKDIGQSFASIGSAWKAAIAGIGAVAISGAITKELQATEKSVAAFISATGGVKEARANFEMLQQAARDTIQPFDSLKAVTLDLRRNGIQATAETLKTFSQIAYGTGQSIETVGSAFTAAMQGRYKSLNQLGIVAKQEGDQLALTYKGTTTQIEKSADALSAYFQKIGKENEGVLDYLQSGVTGALNQLENAWGDFYRAIGESGIGEMITESLRGVANILDAITEKLKSPEWAANLEAIRGAFASMADAVIGIMKQAGDAWDGFISSFEDAAEDGTSAAATYFNNFFKLVGIGISGLFASLKELVGLLGRVGESIGRALSPDQRRALMNAEWKEKVRLNPELTNNAAEYEKFIKNYNVKRWDNHSLLGDISDAAADAGKNISDAIDIAAKNAADAAVKRAKENALAAGLSDRGGPIAMTGTGTGTGGGKGGGRGSAARAERDSWEKYQNEIIRIKESGYSKLEKLREEYNQRIAAMTEAFNASQTATQNDFIQAKAVIDADYERQYKEMTEEAQQFLRDIRDDELEQLQADYDKKLEMLTEYHNSQLISESEFLAARDKLQKDFDKSSKKIKSEKGSLFSEETQEDLKAFTEGLDSISNALSGVTSGMEKSSGAYKAMFAIQKSFSIASAMLSCINAWANALGDLPWPANLAAYAQAVAMTGALMGQLTSVTMHDKGGKIPAGGVGIVGEYGPELIHGPASVTSRRQTAELARGAMSGGVVVNLYENKERAGQVDQTQEADGDRVINIFVSNIRRGGQIAQTLESTYQVRRYGA